MSYKKRTRLHPKTDSTKTRAGAKTHRPVPPLSLDPTHRWGFGMHCHPIRHENKIHRQASVKYKVSFLTKSDYLNISSPTHENMCLSFLFGHNYIISLKRMQANIYNHFPQSLNMCFVFPNVNPFPSDVFII